MSEIIDAEIVDEGQDLQDRVRAEDDRDAVLEIITLLYGAFGENAVIRWIDMESGNGTVKADSWRDCLTCDIDTPHYNIKESKSIADEICMVCRARSEYEYRSKA